MPQLCKCNQCHRNDCSSFLCMLTYMKFVSYNNHVCECICWPLECDIDMSNVQCNRLWVCYCYQCHQCQQPHHACHLTMSVSNNNQCVNEISWLHWWHRWHWSTGRVRQTWRQLCCSGTHRWRSCAPRPRTLPMMFVSHDNQLGRFWHPMLIMHSRVQAISRGSGFSMTDVNRKCDVWVTLFMGAPWHWSWRHSWHTDVTSIATDWHSPLSYTWSMFSDQ